MTTPEESQEEAKKIVPKPRQHQTSALESLGQIKSDSSVPERETESDDTDRSLSTARKRPSPALRPSGSSPDAREKASFPQDQSQAIEPPPSRSRRNKGGFQTPIPLGLALVLAIILMGGVGFFSYTSGSKAGFQKAESAAIKESVDLTPEFLARLDRSLALLQNNNGSAALEELKALEAEEPDVATLSLLMANAALLADNPAEASKRISDSISKRESVSDALTLQAIIEAKLASDSDYKKMGSPKVRIEQLLRQAIAADSSNARPYFELATLKRFEQKNEEALELLRSAQCRLSAADSRVITDTAIALTTLQTLPDAELKPAENPRPIPDEIFAAAYVAMRLGDFARAASILETAKSLFPEPIFRQILKDPAFLPYLKEPALTDFFKPSEQTEKK